MKYSFERDFIELGLSEKESKVYFASLSLGAATAQKIAAAANVNRPTAYVQIESLTQKGLMASVKKGKKTFFVAEPAVHLVHLVDNEVTTALKKKKLLEEILPKLASVTPSVQEKPKVLLFEGLEGLREIHEDIISSVKAGASIENISSVAEARDLVEVTDMKQYWNKLLAKRIRIRALVGKVTDIEYIDTKHRALWVERRVPASIENAFGGELVIYGNKLAALSFRGKILGVIVESQEIVATVRALFEMAWASAK